MFSRIGPLELLIMAILALLLLCVPSFIAHRRRVRRMGWVVAASVLGVFTGVFWFVALFMALSMTTHEPGSGQLPGDRPAD
ncbi:superinfection immunity protein [Streptomyces sp. NPDC051684]|uniref:superinfection immunity protein n=1 Tax=Streptomyces sp. NPDC051684 TaxID=3365670 RepID=UPI00378FA78A